MSEWEDVTGVTGVTAIVCYAGEEDVESLNKLAVSEWEDITGVALLTPYRDNLIEFLPRYGLDLKVCTAKIAST